MQNNVEVKKVIDKDNKEDTLKKKKSNKDELQLMD